MFGTFMIDHVAPFQCIASGVWPAFVTGDERVLVFDQGIEARGLPNNAALDAFDAVYGSLR